MFKNGVRCVAIILSLFTTCYASSFLSGPVDFTQMNPNVLYSKIFAAAPSTNASVFSYQSTEFSPQIPYSQYQITVVNHLNQLSHYKTTEHPVDAPVPLVAGEGIGFGGIVSLAYEKSQVRSVYPERPKWAKFYKKFEIISVKNVEGNLFPLKVGNQLSFDYVANVKTGNYTWQEHGEYLYQVVKKLMGYKGPTNPVRGPVYVIKLSRKTQSDSFFMPMNEYYFSTQLGWYVQAKYYREGQVVVTYRLTNWS